MKIEPARKPAARARDVYCFFDNTDAKLRAPFDAQTLMRELGLEGGVKALQPRRERARYPSPEVPAAL